MRQKITLLFCLLAAVAAAEIRAQEPKVREGTFQVLVSDDFEGNSSKTEYVLVTPKGEWIKLVFEAGVPPGWKSGDRVRVSGQEAEEVFSVTAAEKLEQSSSQAPSSWSTGPKKVLVILVNFTNDTSQPYTVAQATTTVFGASGSVAAFYNEVSFGATTLTGDVTPWLTMPIVKPTTCDPNTIETKARAAATTAGYNLANYQFPVYVFPHIPCGWAGLGYVGWGGSWINQALSVYVTTHELGHNYGLLHAHSLDCGAAVYGSTCVRSEYGDPFDTMGNGLRHFNASSKDDLGWFPGGSVATLGSGSATYDLQPLESASGLRAVKLPTTAGRTYWLEFRQGTGFDNGLSAVATSGAMLHLGPSAVGGSDLLDATPDGSTSTASFGDAPIAVGGTFTDAAASLTVTTVSKTGAVLQVQVDYGPMPAPAVSTINPLSGTAAGGTSVSISGSNFLSGAAVSIGGSPATVTYTSPTTIFATTSTHAVGDADVVVTNQDAQAATLTKGFFYDFADVPPSNPFHNFVVKLVRDNITAGCGGNNYCPLSSVTRSQMAVLLLRSKDGSAYTPPPCTSPVFADVPCSSGFAPWVNELAARGVTAGGCGSGNYCGALAVTRGQMATLLLRTHDGSSYTPPACTTAPFTDVPCSNPFAIWIKELVARGITAGCGGGKYCPNNPATRGQMAVFLVTTFGL